MYHKCIFVLFILCAWSVSAQSNRSIGSHVSPSLHGIPDDDVVAGQIIPAQQSSANSAQLQFTFSTFQFPGVSATIAFGVNNQGRLLAVTASCLMSAMQRFL